MNSKLTVIPNVENTVCIFRIEMICQQWLRCGGRSIILCTVIDPAEDAFDLIFSKTSGGRHMTRLICGSRYAITNRGRLRLEIFENQPVTALAVVSVMTTGYRTIALYNNIDILVVTDFVVGITFIVDNRKVMFDARAKER